FLSALMGALHDPTHFESFLYKRFVELQEDPLTLEKTIDEAFLLFRDQKTARKAVLNVVNEMLPAGTQGRSRKITTDDFATFLNTIEKLKPASMSLLKLGSEYSNQDTVSILDFVEPQYPEAVRVLRKHVNTLDFLLSADSPLSGLTRTVTRAQRLAEAIAGAEWQLTPSYAHQKAAEARRFVQKQSEK